MRGLTFFLLTGFLYGSFAFSQPSWPVDTCPCAQEHDKSVLNNQLYAKNKIVNVTHSGGIGTISFSTFLDELGTKDSTTYIIAKSTQPYVVGCRTIYIGGWSASNVRRCIQVRGETGNRNDVVLAGADPAIDPNFWKSGEYGGSSSCSAGKVFQIVSAEHVLFADMTLRNFAGKTIAIDGGLDNGKSFCGKDVRLHNLDIWDCGSQLIKVAGAPVSSRNCILECSKIHYSDGLFVESNYQTQGIDVHRGRNWIVRDNFFQNIRMHAGTGSWGTGILFWDNSDSALMERNLIMNCDFAFALGLGDNDTTDHMTAVNNLIINDDNSGNWKPDDVFATKTNQTIHGGFFHNTIYNPYTGGAAFAVCNSALPVKNNIYVSGTTNRCASQSNNLVADASWFINPATFDFHLKANHTVTSVAGVDQDIEEHGRANPSTAGAFEFGSTSCSYTISPASITLGSGTGSGSVNVTSGCGCNWTATSNDGWITITSGSSGDGNGMVNYSITSSNSSNKRVGTLTIAGKTFSITQTAVSIENEISGSFVYPNPAKDIININQEGTISIYDLNGILQIQKQITSVREQIDVSNLSSGVYFIKISNQDKINIYKFIKE
jgi:hypothetical protein